MNISRLLLVLLFIATMAFQSKAGLIETQDISYFEISSDSEYLVFLETLKSDPYYKTDAQGRPYSVLNAKLMADITIPAIPDYMIGNEGFGYAGTFDGNAHTITIDLKGDATPSFSLFAELSAMANVKHSVTNLKIQYNGELKFVENTVFAPLARYISGQLAEVKDPTVSIHDVYIVLPNVISANWGTYFNGSLSSGMIAYAYYQKDAASDPDIPQLVIDGCVVSVPQSDVTTGDGQPSFAFPHYFFVAESYNNNSLNIDLTSKNVVLRDVLDTYSEIWDSEFYPHIPEYYYGASKFSYSLVNNPSLAEGYFNKEDDDIDYSEIYGFWDVEQVQRCGLEIINKIFIEDDNCWGMDLNNPTQMPVLLSNDEESDIRLYVHGDAEKSNIPHNFNKYGICDAVSGAPHYEKYSIVSTEKEEYIYIENEGQFISWASESGLSYEVRLKPRATFDFTPNGADFNWTNSDLAYNFAGTLNGQGATIKFYSHSSVDVFPFPSEGGEVYYEYAPHMCRPLFGNLSSSAYIHDLIIDADISDVFVDLPDDYVEEPMFDSHHGVLAANVYMSGSFPCQITFENVTVKGSLISHLPESVGGFVGDVTVNDYYNSGNHTIKFVNCASEIKIESSGNVSSAGGFVGRVNDAKIDMTGCKSTGKVAISDVSHEAYSGGFVGYCYLNDEDPNKPSITNSYNTAKLIATTLSQGPVIEGDEVVEEGVDFVKQTYVASLIGYLQHSGTFTQITYGLDNCYAFYEEAGDNNNTPVCNGSNYQASGIRFIGGRSNDKQTLYCYSENDPNNNYFTREQFHSGYITYLLNNEDINGTVWCLDATTLLPELGSKGLKLYKHGENVSTDEHKFENGVCAHGGDFEDPVVEKDKDKGNTVYIVSNAGQMMRLNEMFKENPGQFLNSTIKLGNDIDLSAYTWRSNINLNCSFLGNGNTIKFVSNYDSYIERINKGQFEDEIEHVTPATGLFLGFGKTEDGSDELIVSDLKLEVDIETKFGADETDAALGVLFSRLNVDGVSLKIDHVSARGSIALSDSPSQVKIGGLIGSVYAPKGLTITNSFTDINIAAEQLEQQEGLTADGSVVYRHIGGLLGFVESSSVVSVMGCATRGSISDTGRSFSAIGGIVGSLYSSNSYIIKNYTTTRLEINNSSTYIGSFIGHIANIDKNFSANNYMSMFAYYSEDNEPQLYDLNSNKYTKRRVNHIGNVGLFNNNEWEDKLIYSYSSYATLPLEPVDGAMEERTDLTADMLKSGKIAYLFSETKFYVTESSYFSQKLGEQDYPVLVAELLEDQEPYTVYPTCNENVFANVNYWKYLYLDGEIPAGAEFEHQYNSFHVCKYCGRIEEGEWDNEVVIEDTEDLVNMVDNLTLLTENSIPVKVTVTDNIVYSDVNYAELTAEELQETLPQKESIGTAEKPFVGSFDGAGNDLINFAFSQNGLFGQIGQIADEDASDEEKAEIEEANKNVIIENVSIANGVIYNNLENVVKDVDENNEVETYYAAALANVNNGVIEYCSFVGAMSIPEGVDENKVMPCLVGENNGLVSHSFVYFTNLDELSSLSDDGNKAAILVKGNAGIGRNSGGAGQSKKVAANTDANFAVDDYGQSEDSKMTDAECLFSNDEFASGVVAYWLNFDGVGYDGNYSCKYSQGILTPVLADADGSNAVHRVVYTSNKSTEITGKKPYANAGSVLNLSFSEAVSSVTVNNVEAQRISDTSYRVTIPNVKTPDVNVKVTYKSGSTDIEILNPDRTNVVATSEGIRVFGAEGQTVSVFNLSGSLVYSSPLSSNDVIIPNLVRGLYFVKVGNTTTKLLL